MINQNLTRTDATDLTVIIPAHNAADTLRKSVLSAITVSASQVIVVDDGSTDMTSESVRDLPIQLLRQENLGPANARKSGLNYARGDFVLFLDADDELIAEGVLKSLQLLRSDPSKSVAAGRVVSLNGSGVETLLDSAYPSVTTRQLLKHGHGPFPPGAALIRRTHLEASFQLKPPALTPRYAEDYELFVRLSMVAGICQHDIPSLKYLRFAGRSFHNAEAEFRDKEGVRHYYAECLGISISPMTAKHIKAAVHFRRARAYRAERNFVLAISSFAIGAWSCPTYTFQKIVQLGSRRK